MKYWMKSREQFPPGGWRFRQPETQWEVKNPKSTSFRLAVDQLLKHRAANPYLAQKHGWALERKAVEDELDNYNALLCANAGADNFIRTTPGGDDVLPKPMPPQRLSAAALAVGGVRKAAIGVGVMLDWLGDGLAPVPQELANARAAICADCPHNADPNWIQRLDALAAKQVQKLLEARHKLQLETPHDHRLMTCQICDCALKLKCHAPLKHILANTPDDQRERLPEWCWINKEHA